MNKMLRLQKICSVMKFMALESLCGSFYGVTALLLYKCIKLNSNSGLLRMQLRFTSF